MRPPTDDELDVAALIVRASLERLLIFVVPDDDQAATSIQHRHRDFQTSVGLLGPRLAGKSNSGEGPMAPPRETP